MWPLWQTIGMRSLEVQGLCYPVVCAHPQSTGSASWRKSLKNHMGGRKWPGAWKDRGGQATLDPILRPQSPGLSCAGCQPLTTCPAPKALAVPVNRLWLTNNVAETTPQSPHLRAAAATTPQFCSRQGRSGERRIEERGEREIVDDSVHHVDRQRSPNSGTSSLTSP